MNISFFIEDVVVVRDRRGDTIHFKGKFPTFTMFFERASEARKFLISRGIKRYWVSNIDGGQDQEVVV